MDKPFSLYKRHIVGKAECHQPREPSTGAQLFQQSGYKERNKGQSDQMMEHWNACRPNSNTAEADP
jgi:hypothetical protein